MSLRRLSYVASKSHKGGSKTQKGRFRYKIALRLKNVCHKVFLCENCQWQSCKAFIGLTLRAKMIGGGNAFYLKFRVKLTALEQMADFLSISTCSTSALTPKEKVQLSLIWSPLRRFQWAQDKHRTLSLILLPHFPLKGWLKNAVSKIWLISCDNSETVRDRMLVTINH